MTDADDFAYELPEELVARTPAERREAARLLLVEPDGGLRDATFSDFPAQLRAGDVLVINETEVVRARLHARRESGGAVEVLLLRPAAGGAFRFDPAEWLALVKPGRRLRPGIRLTAGGAGFTVTGIEPDGTRRLRFDDGVDVAELLRASGELPLPPYVGPGGPERAARYQTVFARVPGSVAAPTASLHFTDAVLAAVAARGVTIARLTLDVGIGTFRPMRPGPLERHEIHAERYAIPAATAAAVMAARAEGRRVVAAGTTVVRALEGAAAADGTVRAGSAETRLFITPGYRFAIVDALLTNFHLPRSTLLALVGAFVGTERMWAAYAHAVAERYRFFSFGDAMFAERAPVEAKRAGMQDTPILEISRLAEIFEDDTAGMAELLEAAMGTGLGYQKSLRGALTAADANEVMRAAHAIKGSSANIGGNEVAELAGRIESSAKAGVLDGMTLVCDELDAAYERLRDAVREFRQSIA